MKAFTIILISFFLCSCIELTSIKTDQNSEGNINFFIKKEGLIFKTQRPVSWLQVYFTDSNDKRNIMWSIVANEVDQQKGAYNLPKPESVVYGVVPEGYVEKKEAKPLDANVEYKVMGSGPGYGASGSFKAEK